MLHPDPARLAAHPCASRPRALCRLLQGAHQRPGGRCHHERLGLAPSQALPHGPVPCAASPHCLTSHCPARRYELHHGVRISDSALVDAAVMSDRYIADRFLPDKAIDLVDEAAAKLKMEITSKPLALDEADRRVLQLEMERLSLSKASQTDRCEPFRSEPTAPARQTGVLPVHNSLRCAAACCCSRPGPAHGAAGHGAPLSGHRHLMWHTSPLPDRRPALQGGQGAPEHAGQGAGRAEGAPEGAQRAVGGGAGGHAAPAVHQGGDRQVGGHAVHAVLQALSASAHHRLLLASVSTGRQGLAHGCCSSFHAMCVLKGALWELHAQCVAARLPSEQRRSRHWNRVQL